MAATRRGFIGAMTALIAAPQALITKSEPPKAAPNIVRHEGIMLVRAAEDIRPDTFVVFDGQDGEGIPLVRQPRSVNDEPGAVSVRDIQREQCGFVITEGQVSVHAWNEPVLEARAHPDRQKVEWPWVKR
jgi:hypothetical protein